MDMDRLSEFLTVCEAGSFKAAAARLGVAPNVLSTRFRTLERSMGAQLSRRNAHKFELTEAGMALRKQAPALLEEYERMLSSMQSMKGVSFDSLKLQVCGQFLAPELGPFLDVYCRAHPGMFLELHDENACRLWEGLKSGQMDAAFAIGRETDYADIPGRIILNRYSNMMVHVPADHPLSRRDSISFSELDGQTFILYPNMLEPCIRQLQIRMLEQSGIRYTIYEDSGSPLFFDLLVPVGKGVRLWNWTGEIAPNTALIPIRDPGYETCMFLLYNPETDNPTTEHFIRHFLAFREARK